jgi:hypothetical protein
MGRISVPKFGPEVLLPYYIFEFNCTLFQEEKSWPENKKIPVDLLVGTSLFLGPDEERGQRIAPHCVIALRRFRFLQEETPLA